ncbi:MAG: glycosyltransferase family 4 protein, partial [Verrucomicrobiae bacterium]|nr:glycosyltransferase family 4 protein [Verrucomicrobiae bacterium]
SRFNQSDAEVLRPKRTVIVSNGIPDPCPDFAHTLASVRRDRAVLLQRLYGASLSTSGAHRAQRPAEIVRVLYLAHCTRDKGFFDAIEGVRLANAIMSEQKKPISFELTLVGAFLKEHEKAEFEALRSSIGAGSWLRYLGFMGEPEKWDAYRRADVFCFPTYFPFEAQPMNLIEALAFGLPIVTTRWRSIPEYFPADYAGLIEPRRPEQVASAIIAVMTENGAKFRQIFENRFSLGCHLENLAMAIKGSFQAQPV